MPSAADDPNGTLPAPSAGAPIDGPAGRAARGARHGLHWWRELLYVGLFYLLYSVTRNLFGSAGGGSTTHALHNAERVIRLEQWLGIFREQEVQSWFLGWPWFLRFWNIYYGTLHFVVPIGVLVVLFRRWPADYRLWRNTLAFTTGLALLGFSLFPLMPPRLLCDCLYGGGAASERGFVDTLERFGGLWTFDSGTMKSISNQYAAMPSLHVAWSLWCAFALIPRLRRRWAKVLARALPGGDDVRHRGHRQPLPARRRRRRRRARRRVPPRPPGDRVAALRDRLAGRFRGPFPGPRVTAGCRPPDGAGCVLQARVERLRS